MSDQDKRDNAPQTGAAFVAKMVAEYFDGRPRETASIQVTRDNYAGTLTIEIRPATAEPRDFAEAAVHAVAGILDGSVPVIDGPGSRLPPGEHVVAFTVDRTQATAPENVFMPTENPDGTMTTKVPANHPAAAIIGGGFAERAISPVEAEQRAKGARAADHPAPWRWIGSPPAGEVTALVDAAGDELISGSDLPGTFYVDDDGIRELIRLAPEMEQALRYFVGLVGDIRPVHPEVAMAIRILAALDAARKATP